MSIQTQLFLILTGATLYVTNTSPSNPDYRPTDVEALKRYGVKVVLMSGVGHFLMMKDPRTFNGLLGEVIEELLGTNQNLT